jgi:uncharacterized protein with PIN domain
VPELNENKRISFILEEFDINQKRIMPRRNSDKLRECPNCGEMNSVTLSSCTNCGIVLDSLESSSQKKVSKDPDAKKGLFLCPNCGSFVSKGLETCPQCGVAFDESAETAGEKAVEGKDTEEAQKAALFMCPECGAFLAEDSKRCPVCNAEIVEGDDEEEAEEKQVEGEGELPVEDLEEKPVEAKPEDDEARICAVCNSRIPEDSDRCLVCNTPVETEQTRSIEALEELENMIDSVRCTLCGTELSKGATACYNCGAELIKDKGSGVEEEIDRFFDHLDTIEAKRKKPIPLKTDKPELLPMKRKEGKEVVKLKKPITVSSGPSIKLRRIELKPERKYELVFYAALVTFIIHYMGIQSGFQTIEYAALFLYGALLVTCLVLVITLKDMKNLPKKVIIQFLGFILIISLPLRWFFSGTHPVDIPILLVGIVMIGVGLYTVKNWMTTVESTHLMLIYGLALIFFVLLFITTQPGQSAAQVFAVWGSGIGLVVLGLVLTLFRKFYMPVILPIESITPQGGRRMEKAGVLGSKKVYDNEVPWYSKASALLLLDRYKEAMECAEIAIKINSKNEIPWVIKGNALSKMGEQVEALKAFNEAIKLNPGYEVAWNNKGNALARMKKYDDALRCYDEAIRLVPRYREAWVNKGYVLAKLGKYKDAAECAERVISITPRSKAESTA